MLTAEACNRNAAQGNRSRIFDIDDLLHIVQLEHTSEMSVRFRRGIVLSAYLLLRKGSQINEMERQAISSFKNSPPTEVLISINFKELEKGTRCHALITTMPIPENAYSEEAFAMVYSSALPLFLEKLSMFIEVFQSKVDIERLRMTIEQREPFKIEGHLKSVLERASMLKTRESKLRVSNKLIQQQAGKPTFGDVSDNVPQRKFPAPAVSSLVRVGTAPISGSAELTPEQHAENGILDRYGAAVGRDQRLRVQRQPQSFDAGMLSALIEEKYNRIEGYLHIARLPLRANNRHKRSRGSRETEKVLFTGQEKSWIERLVSGNNLSFSYAYPTYLHGADSEPIVYFELKGTARSQDKNDLKLQKGKEALLESLVKLANGPLARHISAETLKKDVPSSS